VYNKPKKVAGIVNRELKTIRKIAKKKYGKA